MRRDRALTVVAASAPPTADALELVAGGLLSVAEVVELTRLSKSKLYELIESRALPSVLVDRRRLIPRRALERFLAERLT